MRSKSSEKTLIIALLTFSIAIVFAIAYMVKEIYEKDLFYQVQWHFMSDPTHQISVQGEDTMHFIQRDDVLFCIWSSDETMYFSIVNGGDHLFERFGQPDEIVGETAIYKEPKFPTLEEALKL